MCVVRVDTKNYHFAESITQSFKKSVNYNCPLNRIYLSSSMQ
ncbi:hypothetical protein rpr22_CDSx853 [Rickettsia prowazekii str. Rp22]|uniref:Uncharacterized protein n=1 Tax=Rickettsia prowazekii (strain Rp22) TaxID=449216 RepID=D5AY52_RICPP|nr:hypothetical protein rpr22_CDSx853 [Rickettsia prowazekii str. Rp22]